MKPNYILYYLFIYFFYACSPYQINNPNSIVNLKKDTTIKYAKKFSISSNKNQVVIYLFGNKNNADTTATFIISPLKSKLIPTLKNIYFIKSPCKKIASLSSIYTSMLSELGVINNIVAIDNIDYTNNSIIIEKYKNNLLIELSKNPIIDLEKTIKINPDVIFTFGLENDKNNKVCQTKIPIAICLDHLEESPLARAEWIKFFGAFVNKKERADSIFNEIERKYNELKLLSQLIIKKPTVFSEIKNGETWYLPAGKSYVAKLLEDAGADYILKNDKNNGSIPFSFEQVYSKAKNAQFWINLSNVKTKYELLSYENRYAQFKALKSGNLYNNNKRVNHNGYSDYWESGMIFPDRILNDLLVIFHPELKLKTKLFYYQKIY